ncbi:MAG TPA: hypothetical protein VFX16_01310 [Pseudonocardiaceae bacterium]|nr:hypothetical protein [Pseudonocardiaceae bacterium]
MTRQLGVSVRELQQFVSDWYATLDRHEPFEKIADHLDEQQLRFVFPEVTVSTVAGLRDWYEGVVRRFFDEIHRVDVADVDFEGDRVKIHVVVNWTTRVWDPPAAKSQILSYDADQSWEVVIDSSGRPRLRDYVVNGLAPVGDTPELF